jgi:hypothetical protein
MPSAEAFYRQTLSHRSLIKNESYPATKPNSTPHRVAAENNRASSSGHNRTADSEINELRHYPAQVELDSDAVTKEQMRWKGRPTTYLCKRHQVCYTSCYTRPAVEIVGEALKKLDESEGNCEWLLLRVRIWCEYLLGFEGREQ